jgi:hypothetical protein
VVEVEHIDGNWRNNLPENLTLLCPNCHALTPTFRGLNRGHGRPGRGRAHVAVLSRRRKDYRILRMENSEGAQLRFELGDAGVAQLVRAALL